MYIISLILVLISSYLLTSIVCKKEKNTSAFLYLMLIAFSQIVLSFEILSLFKAISKNNFFICNIVFALISLILFIKNGKNFYKPYFEKKEILSALKRDKILFFLSECFIVFLIFQLITVVFFPITFGDALAYYLTRCTEWIQQGSIQHFITSDARELIMPVNMDFLYTWKLLFTKSEMGIGIFSYVSFLLLIYTVYNFLKELNFSVRQRLWAIYVLASFPLIIVEMYTPCADMFIGALILSAIYLYLKALKYNTKIPLYFSSLAYALAVGTKTTAIIAFPVFFLILALITLIYKKDKLKTYFAGFLILLFINFIVFSSYNYILNFIQYGNFISSVEQFELNRFYGGFKAWFGNIIKYGFAFFDMSGIKDLIGYNKFIINCQQSVLNFFGIGVNDYTSLYHRENFNFNPTADMMDSFLGIIGILVFVPSIMKSIINLNKRKSLRIVILGILSLGLILNICIFSRVMVFTGYNMRYILSFVIIAIPVCVYSYKKKNDLFKFIITLFIFNSLIIISHNYPMSLLFSYTNYKIKNPAKEFKINMLNDEINVYNYFKERKKANIAIILSPIKTPNYHIENLRLIGFKLDKILLENIEAYDLSKYDYIITGKRVSYSTVIENYKERLLNPELCTAKCIYYDYKRNIINNINGNKPARVECIIPYEYFISQNFIPLSIKTINTYTIWENTKKL